MSPSLACDAALDLQVKSEMLSDLLNMAAIRPHEVPKASSKPSKPSPSEIITRLESRSRKKLSPFEKKVIRESEQEKMRSGRFKCLFPRTDVSRLSYLYHLLIGLVLPICAVL